jgi:hypothetical protein
MFRAHGASAGLVPGVGAPGAPRSARYAAPRRSEPGGTRPTLSTPMSPPAGKRYCETTRVRPRRSKAKIQPLCSSGAMSWQAKRPNVRGATAIPSSTRGPAWRMTLEAHPRSTPSLQRPRVKTAVLLKVGTRHLFSSYAESVTNIPPAVHILREQIRPAHYFSVSRLIMYACFMRGPPLWDA